MTSRMITDGPTLNKALPDLDIIATRCLFDKGRLAAAMKADEQNDHAGGGHAGQPKAPQPVQAVCDGSAKPVQELLLLGGRFEGCSRG